MGVCWILDLGLLHYMDMGQCKAVSRSESPQILVMLGFEILVWPIVDIKARYEVGC